MTSPIVRSTFCPCGRNLHGNSVRMGLTECGACRERAKYQAGKAIAVPLGRYVGEFVLKRLEDDLRNNYQPRR